VKLGCITQVHTQFAAVSTSKFAINFQFLAQAGQRKERYFPETEICCNSFQACSGF
jgi:hypothetical protein